MLIESTKKAELLHLYYSNLGDGYFLNALSNFSNETGFGLGEIWCVFASELQPWEEGYFGEVGVAYFYDFPAVESDLVLVIDYGEFYSYLYKASTAFIKRNPDKEKEVQSLISQIKLKLNIE